MKDNLFNILNDFLGSGYKSNLDDSMTPEQFNDVVSSMGMVCRYDIKDINGQRFVFETWEASKKSAVRINRIYPFTEENINDIETTERKKLLTKLLQESVMEEKYEDAAKLRDMINSLP